MVKIICFLFFNGNIDSHNEFKKSQAPYSTGISTQLDKFQTNLVDLIANYDISDKFR